jgi:ABC-type multidrug transport system fused ATPase/permease subunit
MKGRTALVIAHRLATIAKCDRILVIDKGEIIEQGSHNELMVPKGADHRFFQLQSRL